MKELGGEALPALGKGLESPKSAFFGEKMGF
jgi:hypothetical protein